MGSFRHFVNRVRRGAPVVRDIPSNVKIGAEFRTPHRGIGIVVNQHTTIGDRVSIFPNVLIGRFDADLVRREHSPFDSVVIEDDVILYGNAVVVAGPGVTTIGRGSIVGAGAVLLNSTGPGEVWVGNPARKVGMRPGWPTILSTRNS